MGGRFQEASGAPDQLPHRIPGQKTSRADASSERTSSGEIPVDRGSSRPKPTILASQIELRERQTFRVPPGSLAESSLCGQYRSAFNDAVPAFFVG